MNNSFIILAASILLGLAVTLGIYGGRVWLMGRFKRDQQWMRETYLRFYPDPINAGTYMLAYYAAFVLDPDGHRVEAVCHAPEAPAIEP